MTRQSSPDPVPAPGQFAYDGLDRVLHEKARLGILVSLTTQPEGLTFVELKQLCSLTDGNLSRHLEALAQESLVSIHKGHHGRRPQTRVRLTAEGRRRFLAYLEELERVVRDAQTQGAAQPSPRSGLAPG